MAGASSRVATEVRQNAPSVPVSVPSMPPLLPSIPSDPKIVNPSLIPPGMGSQSPGYPGAGEQAVKAQGARPGLPGDPATDGPGGQTQRKADAFPGDPKAEDKKDGDKKEAASAPAAIAAVAPSGDEAKTPAPADPALPAPPSAMFNGSFTQSVPLEVPAFRGYEPKLRLVYDSNHGLRAGGLNAGWVGHGWHLEGTSEIVRIAPRRGAPRFDASDTWMIDGEEMVACGPGVESPSCAQGGTHVTRVESYRRYAYDGNANQWVVSDRDGTRRFYLPVASFPAVSQNFAQHAVYYRYVLHRIVDPNNNTVTFGYTCQTRPA